MTRSPWKPAPLDATVWLHPPRDYGILPFWFLNGDLDPEEMRRQLREFRDKRMSGIILHGRYGLEMPYLSTDYLDRIRLAIGEGTPLGLQMWIYDEMNWPSGTADGQVLRQRPDLAQHYLECVSFNVRGPFFTYLTGADSRYLDFERSTPVASFAVSETGQVIDLTPNLSFGDVIPWEVPPGNWRLMYLVGKRADYYIDALDPEATATFLRLGYDPYLSALPAGSKVEGFYTDEPAMHYFVTGADNPIVPWTKDMFRRFLERNGYSLRPRLPDLFFDISDDSARVRYDFYSTLTEFYSAGYYQQIHEWCRERGMVFTGHLLYEEWLRKMIRVEGNPFKHYAHFDVIGVDHLYPFVGGRDRPDEHVAMKLASSAAHYYNSPRVLCESFGGIFMDTTMQRMKWITDWEYVLGVNLVNPHGFHYTLEGPRKRDWPPSMFYQYPWWHYYSAFSDYVTRLSTVLSGGRHVAKVGVIWPINSMFATYTPQTHNPLGDRTERDFNALTDLLLRLHHDFDYVDEDILAGAEIKEGEVHLGNERYELLILPPLTHIKSETLARLEEFVESGGRILGMVFLPDRAFGPDRLLDISERVAALFGVEPIESQRIHRSWTGLDTEIRTHDTGVAAFLRTYALARLLPASLQRELNAEGEPENPHVVIEAEPLTRYFYSEPGTERREITEEVETERGHVETALSNLINQLITPDVTIDNPEISYLHRVKNEGDVYFLTNPTFDEQSAQVTLSGDVMPGLWDPSTGATRPIAPSQVRDNRTSFSLSLPPAGSSVVVTLTEQPGVRVVDTNMVVEAITQTEIHGYAAETDAYAIIERNGHTERVTASGRPVPAGVSLDGPWDFVAEDDNALVIDRWLATEEVEGAPVEQYAAASIDTSTWLPMTHGAWSCQLPAEPTGAYPVPVWYRIPFCVDEVPSRLALIVDGFAGSDWSVYVNGAPVTEPAGRGLIDSEMPDINITNLIHRGDNVLALRLTVTSPTDGLLDLVKLVGTFSLDRADGAARIAAPRTTMEPVPWSGQGYPYYSGRGVYRRQFTLPQDFQDCRVFLEPPLKDDVLEVVVNGQRAGIRLWVPYEVEITPFIQPGSNTVELRIANTLINLLEAVERPSGLNGPPRLIGRSDISLPLPRDVAASVEEP